MIIIYYQLIILSIYPASEYIFENLVKYIAKVIIYFITLLLGWKPALIKTLNLKMSAYHYEKYPPPGPNGKMTKSESVKSSCTLHFDFYILTFFLCTLLPHTAFSAGTKTKGSPKSISAFIENKGQIIDQNFIPNPGVLYLLNTLRFNVQLRRCGFSYDVYRIFLIRKCLLRKVK